MRFRVVIACCIAALTGCAEEGAAPADPPIVVFAAASMTDAVREISDAYAQRTGRQVVTSFAATSTLARQIEAGAHADIFISADLRWMESLIESDRVDPSTRVDIAGNRLALVAPIDGAPIMIEFDPTFDLASALPGPIAVADPSHVPAGRYAREAFESLGWWKAIEGRLVTAPDVRAALRLVEVGEAATGLVYASDVASSDRVRIVGLIPEALHTPIRYSAALCAGASEGSHEFFAMLQSDEARRMLSDAGFRPAAPSLAPDAP